MENGPFGGDFPVQAFIYGISQLVMWLMTKWSSIPVADGFFPSPHLIPPLVEATASGLYSTRSERIHDIFHVLHDRKSFVTSTSYLKNVQQHLSGWWYTGIPTPLKNMSSSVGMMTLSTEWENQSHVPKHQPVIHSTRFKKIYPLVVCYIAMDHCHFE